MCMPAAVASRSASVFVYLCVRLCVCLFMQFAWIHLTQPNVVWPTCHGSCVETCIWLPLYTDKIHTNICTYICMTALFNICYACTCANIRLSRTVCICIHTHAHTHSVSCATVCRICICLSVATTSIPPPLSLHPLYNICILTQLGPIVILFGRLTVSRSAPAVVYNMSGHRSRTGMYNASTYVSLCVCVWLSV